jgi:amidase
MLTVARINRMHSFGAETPFVAEIESGDTIVIETSVGSRAPTGPVAIQGAAPGDVVAVTIRAIALSERGSAWARPGSGVLGVELSEVISEPTHREITLSGGWADFGGGIRFRLRPMVGVVGVAPRDGEQPTVWPGRHGGNLDCGRVGIGATIYLPVFRSRAGLGIGDVHARMGNGEVMTSGLEVEANVTVRVDVHSNVALTGPVVETEDAVAYLASARSLDLAVWQAVRRGVKAVQLEKHLDLIDAGILTSIIGGLEISQVVNPLVTVQLVFEKGDLELRPLDYPV